MGKLTEKVPGWLWGLLVVATIFWLDQLTKNLIFSYLNRVEALSGRPQVVVTGFFNLTRVWNSGVSFGLFNSLPGKKLILSFLSVAIMLLILYLYRHTQKTLEILALATIVGGALGNLSDRLRYGAVADFLDFHYEHYYWPAFNVADMSICLGVLLLVWQESTAHTTAMKNKEHGS